MANPYSVLGVSKDADEKAIKSAFRKLAMRYHPDQNQSNKAAQAKFAEINQAYEIIGDKKKRAQYDRGEIDDEGKEKFAGFGGGNPFGGGARGGESHGSNPFGGGMGDAGDIFSEIFGSAFGGAQQRRGSGDPFANMHGRRQTQAPSTDIEMKAAVTISDLMRGKATVRMPDGKQMAVSIPPEAENRQVIRLKGQGRKAPGTRPGDALVTLVFKTDPVYRVDGIHLRRDIDIPLKTAILGGKISVPTMDGKLVLNIPAKTNSGQTFRLKGKGLPKKGGGFGDLLVSSSIQLPEEGFEDLAKFLKQKTS